MSKKISHKNKGKSLYGSDKGHVRFEQNQFFVGIVDHVVLKDSPDINKTGDSDFIDDRNSVYVYPIDSKDTTSLKKCVMLNSHNVDIPLSGEPVLVAKTNVGNVVLDRFSPHAFGVNYELGDYLLNNKFLEGNIRIELDDEIKRTVGIERVKPFYSKIGSKSFFGRNNQYIIFDYGDRINADAEEQEYSAHGSFIRIGIKDSESQTDSKTDRSKIIVGVDGKMQSIFDTNIESEFNVDVDNEPNNGIGIESDELVFIGRDFVVIYSQKDMLLGGRNLYTDFKNVVHKAENIKNGSENADQPTILGNELIDMMNDLISNIQRLQYNTPSGPTSGLMPTSLNSLRRFKNKYLKKNKSPIHSRKIFNE